MRHLQERRGICHPFRPWQPLPLRMDRNLRGTRADPFRECIKGCSSGNATGGFFSRRKQEFYRNLDHQDQSIDGFVNDLKAYLV